MIESSNIPNSSEPMVYLTAVNLQLRRLKAFANLPGMVTWSKYSTNCQCDAPQLRYLWGRYP